jgi:YD repeat-containing protein
VATYAAVFANNAYLEAPSINAYNFGTGNFTVEAWVKTATAGGSGTLVSRKGTAGGTANSGGFLVVVKANGAIKFATDNGFGFYEVDTAATKVNDGAWHHVAAVRQGATLIVYLDGMAVQATPSGTATPPLNVNNGLALTIGATEQQQEPNRFLSGQMDAVTLWNTSRTAAQVVSDMRATLSGSEPGLVGYWTFDNQSGADASPLHNNAVARGGVTYSSPGVGPGGGEYAVVLAGGGSLSAAANNAYQFGTGDFTLEAWFRAAQAGGSGTIVARKGSTGGAGNGGFLVVLRNDGKLKFATDNGAGFYQTITNAGGANDGLWHHVAAVRQGASLRIYLDGLEIQSTPSGNAAPPLNVNNSLPLTIGMTQQQQEQFNSFSGQLGMVTAWNTARGAAQVAADMRTILKGSEPGLVGYWPFTYGNGLDLSPISNNAVPNGSVNYSTPGAPYQFYAAVLGNQSYLQAPSQNAYQFGTGDFTVEAWIQSASPGGSGTVVARKGAQGGQGNGGFLLVVNANGSIKLATDNGFNFYQFVTQATAANGGAWHFLAAVRRGGRLEIYLDGAAVAGQASGTGTSPLDINNSLPLTIGTTQQTQEPNRFFSGQLDGVLLWNVARSPQAIASDMNTRFSGSEPGLVGYWSFDFRDGRDSSPQRNTASPVGSVSFVPPGAPVGQLITLAPVFTKVGYDGQAVTASWTAVSQSLVTGYKLALFDGQQKEIGSANTSTTDGSIQMALTPGAYTVRVQATGAGIAGPWSDPVAVVVSAPQNLSVTTTAADIQARWDSVPSATSYRLALFDGANEVSGKNTSNTSDSLPLPTDKTKSYTVKVRGLAGANGMSVGPWGVPVGVILESPTLTSVIYDGSKVSLVWTVSSSLSGMTYLASLLLGTTTVGSAQTTDTQADITAQLDPQNSYVVQVRALASGTQGPWGQSAPVMVVAPGALLAGTNGTQVMATWAAVAGVDGYEAGLATGGNWQSPLPVSAPPIVFSGQLTAGVEYQVRVRVSKGISRGPWSAPTPGPFLQTGTVEYDGFGRITSVAYPGVGTTTYAYDAVGNITGVTVA